MKRLVFVVLFATSLFGLDGPTTLRNDDSCDVIVAPAATLLLPYFEVDLANPAGETTFFTIVNVTQSPQIARVTLWSDYAYPVYTFNLFLTGYDVQSINLFDVISRGRVAEPGTSSDSDIGRRSLENDMNPQLSLANCDRLPTRIPSALLADLQNALTTGRTSGCASARVGGTHVKAIGYVTIDAVANCGTSIPTDASYFAGDALYDNVLTGDYQQINSSQNFAQGGAMVHIRAVPEGRGHKATRLPHTFYGSLRNGSDADRRQPLPSTFAARWISGGGTKFATTFKVWREGWLRADAACSVASNSSLGYVEVVRFDEEENPTMLSDGPTFGEVPQSVPTLPSSARVSSTSSLLPAHDDGNVGGWMYMNFNRGPDFPFQPSTTPSQNWVIVSMAADGRYSVDFDAASLDNGCSRPTPVTNAKGAVPAIGPASNPVRPTMQATLPRSLDNDDSCDVKVTPAATLLLPYFEVDLLNPAGDTTLFTVTNVTRAPQIARVTLWTDMAYPVLSFNLFLTGYDAQSINLYDVIVRGLVAPPGTSSKAVIGLRSSSNDANPLLDLSKCGALVERLTGAMLDDVRQALTTGRNSACKTARVGLVHTRAIGYATIDVVQNCSTSMPIDADYFTTQVLYDNVLIGDYQQVNSTQNFAQANAMVHIRAIPEGGAPGSGSTRFARTFYSRLQNGGTRDRRQPLPSTFAARWTSGGSTDLNTTFKIWREGTTSAAGCSVTANGEIDFPDVVRFDEEENSYTHEPEVIFDAAPPIRFPLPAVSRISSNSFLFPRNPDGAVSGWMYLNLDTRRWSGYAEGELSGAAGQAWVVVSMAAEGRYSIDLDATALGNGCSPKAQTTDEDGRLPAIGPAKNP